ncbi:interleukin 17-like protein [Gigantopelta aegis]|uniref:interleukin 17-like protein n=1 Tax=Gigantopelta aegis TaxID=1735272 RepID=UPI001B88DB9B|nr:interleukin 17-like protein [Gigantopelta aegis]
MADGIPIGSPKLARAARSTSTCQTPPNLDCLITTVDGITDGVTEVTNVTCINTNGSSSDQCRDTVDGRAANADQKACPWSYEMLLLPADFYPRCVLQAKCNCRSCARGNDANDCVPVKKCIRVLRKDTMCIDGFHIFRETTIPVVVGCACVTSSNDYSSLPSAEGYDYIN